MPAAAAAIARPAAAAAYGPVPIAAPRQWVLADDSAPPGNSLTLLFVPGAVSMVVHLLLLILLGIVVVDQTAATASNVALIASRDLELSSLDHFELRELERGSADFGMTQIAPTFVASDGRAELTEAPVTNARIAFDGPELTPALSRSAAGRDGVSFFGAVAKGKRIVFVVDNSMSMQGRVVGKITKFERALAELLESISKLGRDKSYYIVFFNATAMRIFDPNPSPGFVPSTRENYDKLYQWLRGVELARGTRGKEAMQIALDLKPDAIYILGDGAFTDDTADALKGMNRYHVKIHTLLFGSQGGRGRDSMETIAKQNGGTFSIVD
ncbi:MAG TPA: vWA domain-containing protein [Pirellulales bacterium]|nr:vWA domain-containing protein [Pirellulales bacterium]